MYIGGLLTVDESVYSPRTCGEIGTKPKDLFEAEVLIDIHIREKGELRRKIELLERQLGSTVDLVEENNRLAEENRRLAAKVEELELKMAKTIKYESKSNAAKARWERQRAERLQNGADGA